MMVSRRYDQTDKQAWDHLVGNSKNGIFLFYRDYMDYHKFRFKDHSLMFFRNNKLIALLPASEAIDGLCSHGGLTFGGLLYGSKLGISDVQEVFDSLVQYMRSAGFLKLIYKSIPFLFSAIPSQEDIFVLHKNKANLERRELSTALSFNNRIRFSKGKREGVKKAARKQLTFEESNDYASFFAMGEKIMKDRHDLIPVHNASEMKLLKDSFSDEIKMFVARSNGEILAGTIVYDYGNAIHTQYMYNSNEGFECGALDFVIENLIACYEATKDYLSFGISTEEGGAILNLGLQRQKEMFGGRSVVHDTYELTLR